MRHQLRGQCQRRAGEGRGDTELPPSPPLPLPPAVCRRLPPPARLLPPTALLPCAHSQSGGARSTASAPSLTSLSRQSSLSLDWQVGRRQSHGCAAGCWVPPRADVAREKPALPCVHSRHHSLMPRTTVVLTLPAAAALQQARCQDAQRPPHAGAEPAGGCSGRWPAAAAADDAQEAALPSWLHHHDGTLLWSGPTCQPARLKRPAVCNRKTSLVILCRKSMMWWWPTCSPWTGACLPWLTPVARVLNPALGAKLRSTSPTTRLTSSTSRHCCSINTTAALQRLAKVRSGGWHQQAGVAL